MPWRTALAGDPASVIHCSRVFRRELTNVDRPCSRQACNPNLHVPTDGQDKTARRQTRSLGLAGGGKIAAPTARLERSHAVYPGPQSAFRQQRPALKKAQRRLDPVLLVFPRTLILFITSRGIGRGRCRTITALPRKVAAVTVGMTNTREYLRHRLPVVFRFRISPQPIRVFTSLEVQQRNLMASVVTRVEMTT
jgi:hypothetical protein